MAGELLYAEASALVKLVVEEPESAAFAQMVDERPRVISSIVTAVELPRAARRATDTLLAAERADAIVRELDLLELDIEVVRVAATLAPPALRSLDAIHLATALSLGVALAGIATYDTRLTEAAGLAGVAVLAPR